VPAVIAGTRAELAELLVPHRAAGRRVGLVCTMGAMHEGHASLMRRTRLEIGPDAPLVVSLFVNPLQFGPNEDLARYPRTFDEDVALCAREGVDIVFAPTVDEVYPGGDPQVTVDPGPLAGVLEGKTRPGHYVGVLTVVAKLFGLVRPEVTVFGEKDYQQLALVRRMSGDLCLGVEVLGGETVREPDGLALSSRNRYLDPEQRQQAVALSRALRAAQEAGPEGYAAALAAAEKVLADAPGIDLDYVVFRAVDLAELDEDARGEARALVAAKVGTTRLIDNMPVVLGAPLRH
jgi:pantoate--beta-alanine ligase